MLQRLAVLVCAAGFAVACGQTDAGITTAVKAKLAADDMVKAYEIDVDTQDHVVTLTGEVETSAARDQAMRLARDTDGVREVVDRLQVGDTAATAGMVDRDTADEARDTAERTGDAAGDAASRAGSAMTDAAITSAVKAKLLADPMVGGLKIDVDTNNGVVTLTGPVNTQAEASEAEKIAKGTEGVKSVVARLRVGDR